MAEEKDAFYVVRKGDIIGIYKNFTDCQAQIPSSVCDTPVSVYKGYCLPKEAEEHLKSRGLKDAVYSCSASDVKADFFGNLVACPVQPSTSTRKAQSMSPLFAKLEDVVQMDNLVEHSEHQLLCNKTGSCIVEFDGASKGNPGQAGAGAVLRTKDGRLISRLREGLGVATNNVAEYKALILGLKYAINKGFKRIHIRGDSQLVCRQIEGTYKTKNPNLAILCREANDLKLQCVSFEIQHIPRELNAEADAQANLAVNLKASQVVEDCQMK